MTKDLIKEEKKVEYLELIYDLIFVYIIGRNNSLLHHMSGGEIQPGMFLAYVLCTLAVIQIWNYSTYYINLYGRNGLREHIFLFSNMFLLYFVAEGTRAQWESYHTQYHVAWAAILLNVALQYLIELRSRSKDPEHRALIRHISATLLIQALLVLGTIPVYRLTGTDVSGIPILFGMVASSVKSGGGAAKAVDFAHLSERAMLYVVFTFGEMVIAVSEYFTGRLTPARVYFSLMSFLIVVGLFLSYGTVYDKIIDREQSSSGLGYMLIHLFIIFGLNNITNSLEFMQDSEVKLLPKMVLLITSFLIFYVSLFLTTGYARKSCKPKAGFYLTMGAFAAAFVGLMAAFRENMYVNIAVTVICVFAVYSVIYRIGRANSK
ncbi:MAG: low temperature requirement protein A [Ruminococcus sp.]|nr:low temperature requirement protein A [Ruminococcus sp.]